MEARPGEEVQVDFGLGAPHGKETCSSVGNRSNPFGIMPKPRCRVLVRRDGDQRLNVTVQGMPRATVVFAPRRSGLSHRSLMETLAVGTGTPAVTLVALVR